LVKIDFCFNAYYYAIATPRFIVYIFLSYDFNLRFPTSICNQYISICVLWFSLLSSRFNGRSKLGPRTILDTRGSRTGRGELKYTKYARKSYQKKANIVLFLIRVH